MKYFLVVAALALMACSMSGVGELEERVDALETTVSYDDTAVNDAIDQIEGQLLALEEAISGIDPGGYTVSTDSAGGRRTPALPDGFNYDMDMLLENVAELSETMEGLPDSVQALNTMLADLGDSLDAARTSLDEAVIQLDSLKLENESMMEDIGSLQWEVSDLRTQFNQIGARDSGSGSGTRPGSGGGTTGGTSGGRGTGGTTGGGR